MLDKISNASQHLLTIINDVLEISKIEAGATTQNLQNFELNSMLSEIKQMFKYRSEQKALSWIVVINIAKEVVVNADQSKVRQILINLIGNAIKFTDKGSIILTVSDLGRGVFQFDLADTGPGISVDEQKTLFSNFTQGKAGTEKGGTGLGLAICDKYIKMMSGELYLASEIGLGSKFSFTLKLNNGDSSHLETQLNIIEQITLKDEYKFTALCVDDIAENREVLGRLLTSCGIDVVYAKNGLEAVNLVKEQVFDIIYMDLLMPVMKGDEAIAIIRNELQQRELICVAVSAFSLVHEVQHYLSIGFNQFIAKPFSFHQIFKSLLELSPNYFRENKIETVSKSNDVGRTTNKPDLSKLTLDETVYVDLKSAVKSNRTSYAKKIFLNILSEQPENREIIEYLIHFIDAFDMGSLLNVLDGISHE
jgi:CheY-like chemotaxis protein